MTGMLVYDRAPSWWARVHVPNSGLTGYYAWLAKSYGMPLMRGNAHGTHITVIRNEEPPNKDLWGFNDGYEIEFWYSHSTRWTDYHLWVDVYSEQLSEVRAKLGYPPKLQKVLSDGRVLEHSFHLTVGRRI